MLHKELKSYYPTQDETKKAINIFVDTPFTATRIAKLPLFIITFLSTLCIAAAVMIWYDYYIVN